MKLMITTAAAALVAVAVPAWAQMDSGYGQSAPSVGPDTSARTKTKPKTEAAPKQSSGKQIKVSSKAQKAIIDLQTTVNKNDFADVPAKVAAAQAVASTPDDRYAIGQLQLKAALASKNNAALTAAVDAVANSGFIDTAEKAKLYEGLGSTLYNAKQYPGAEAAFQKASTIDPGNAQNYELIGESKIALGQNAAAVGDFQHAVQLSLASGAKPEEALLKRAVSVAYDAKSPLVTDLARQWVAAYPSPDSWRNSIAIYRNTHHPDEEGTLDLLRLMEVTGAMTTPGDYALFAEAAADQSNFTEAQAVVDAGISAHVVDPSNSDFRQITSVLKTKPKPTAADLEAASKMSPSATNLLRIGDRFYGMGDYAHAADTYRQVLAKPDADKDVANLHLGMALARSGDKAGATAAFNAVTGSRADIAKYWLIYVQQHA